MSTLQAVDYLIQSSQDKLGNSSHVLVITHRPDRGLIEMPIITRVQHAGKEGFYMVFESADGIQEHIGTPKYPLPIALLDIAASEQGLTIAYMDGGVDKPFVAGGQVLFVDEPKQEDAPRPKH